MRLLLIHSDFLEYEVKDETKVAEDISEDKEEGRAEEALVAFIAAEEIDEEDPDSVTELSFEEIEDVRDRVGADSVVVYPYAHLSDSLASPKTAVNILKGIEERFEEKEVEVLRAPFGWYKSFNISCKGHPLSELSRTITPSEGDEEEEGEEVESEWLVLSEDGEEHVPMDYEGSKNFQKVVESEVSDSSSGGEEPPHVSLMREKELVDYDKLSDAGNLRWYPKGKLVRDLIVDYIDEKVADYGAMTVETPVMYDLSDDAISEHSAKFGERQYRFESGNRNMLLRFAACFGMFSMMNDMYLSATDLPMKMYELSTYSFRREQRGEILGLKRLRAFTMPDIHTACNDLDRAKEEFRKQVLWSLETEDVFDLDYWFIFRMSRDFYEDNQEWISDFVQEIGRPVLVEILEDRKHYWVAKCDLAALDSLGEPLENPTVQIDVESAERFDISYFEDDEEFYPPILHTSPSGSIERVLCAILESAASSDKPQLPLWLSPIQVRFVPIGGEHVEDCEELVDRLESAGIRADIDDRDKSVGKRIRRSETEWVPFTIVFGDQERGSESFPVRVREKGEEVEMSLEDLIEDVEEKTSGKPVKQLPLPVKLSNRPDFV